MKTGIELIAEERQRQIEVEGFSVENDRKYICGELTDAAICYAMRRYWKMRLNTSTEMLWPLDMKYKPSENNRIRDLVKAGALIAAEIDRLNANSKMKVFEFKSEGFRCAFSGRNEVEASEALFEATGGMDIDEVKEIPESEWDEKRIKMHENDDPETKPYYVSIRDILHEDAPMMIYSNDL